MYKIFLCYNIRYMGGNMKEVFVRYLYHSGVIIEFLECIMIFDYYKDPAFILKNLISKSNKKIYFFVSHNHYDHFNPDIFNYEKRVKMYFMHSDCELLDLKKNKITMMNAYDTFNSEDLNVKMYGSTDVGGSFFVKYKDISIFHAGDLNWWHWSGESDVYNEIARKEFFKKIDKFYKEEKNVDFLFFPVDSRLENAKEWGIKYFLEKINVNKLIVPIHMSGTKWIPSYEFKWKYSLSNVWVPDYEGDFYKGD